MAFDEIHKYPKWKNILKDFFDNFKDDYQFIVTGSARLDLFRKSGDSLAGRYFLFHLFPFSLMELSSHGNIIQPPSTHALDWVKNQMDKKEAPSGALEQLFHFGGFPQPFTKASKPFLRRWQDTYLDLIIREDLRDLTRIHELENIATMAQLLKAKVGNPLSLNSLQEDLEVSYNACKSYLKALVLGYFCFLIRPYSKKIARSLKKEPKVYFFDWTLLSDEATRFENFVACELNCLLTFWNDSGLGPFELFYIRTKDKKETDFLITSSGHPWLGIEVKENETNVDKWHLDHCQRLGDIPFIQIVRKSQVSKRVAKNAFVLSANRVFA